MDVEEKLMLPEAGVTLTAFTREDCVCVATMHNLDPFPLRLGRFWMLVLHALNLLQNMTSPIMWTCAVSGVPRHEGQISTARMLPKEVVKPSALHPSWPDQSARELHLYLFTRLPGSEDPRA